MLSTKGNFVSLFLSVYITVTLCKLEEKSSKTTANLDPILSEDGRFELSSVLDDPFKFLISNMKNQMNDDLLSIRHKLTTDENKKDFNSPLLTLIDEMPIIPLSVNDEQHSADESQKTVNETEVTHNMSELGNHLIKAPPLNDFMKIFLNHINPSKQKESQRGHLKGQFESPFSIETLFSDFGDLFKPFDSLIPSGIENQLTNKSSEGKRQGNIGQVYFVELGSNDDRMKKPIQTIPSTETVTPKSLPAIENEQSASLQSIMGDFTDSMKDVIQSLRETVKNLSGGNVLSEKKYASPNIASKLNISIQSQGETQFIPSNSYVIQNKYGLVNITWKSSMQNINNSLCFKLRQDESANIVFEYMQLRIVEGNEIHEYKLKEAVFINTNRTSNETVVIELTGRVGIRFISTGFLDVITSHKSENYSTHWLVFSIAMLGLIVAGLIMVLSYIIFKRNQRYPRKGSISKEAIVY